VFLSLQLVQHHVSWQGSCLKTMGMLQHWCACKLLWFLCWCCNFEVLQLPKCIFFRFCKHKPFNYFCVESCIFKFQIFIVYFCLCPVWISFMRIGMNAIFEIHLSSNLWAEKQEHDPSIIGSFNVDMSTVHYNWKLLHYEYISLYQFKLKIKIILFFSYVCNEKFSLGLTLQVPCAPLFLCQLVQPTELESCSNPLKMPKVLQLQFKTKFRSYGFELFCGWCHKWGKFRVFRLWDPKSRGDFLFLKKKLDKNPNFWGLNWPSGICS